MTIERMHFTIKYNNDRVRLKHDLKTIERMHYTSKYRKTIEYALATI